MTGSDSAAGHNKLQQCKLASGVLLVVLQDFKCWISQVLSPRYVEYSKTKKDRF